MPWTHVSQMSIAVTISVQDITPGEALSLFLDNVRSLTVLFSSPHPHFDDVNKEVGSTGSMTPL